MNAISKISVLISDLLPGYLSLCCSLLGGIIRSMRRALPCSSRQIQRPHSVPPIPSRRFTLFTTVVLSEEEYSATVERLGEKGLAKNYIYDGLIMSAAEKSGADIVYTWNAADFLRVSPPSILSKIRNP